MSTRKTDSSRQGVREAVGLDKRRRDLPEAGIGKPGRQGRAIYRLLGRTLRREQKRAVRLSGGREGGGMQQSRRSVEALQGL